jgi:O-antigen/teichoic acid export membrane protein
MGTVTATATITPERTRWRPLVSAMTKTGGASIASGLLSALATKIVAAVAGPASVALLATLQQTRQAALVAATGNGQTALVRGASAFEGERRREFVRTVAWIFACATCLATLVLIAAPQSVARLAGLPVGAARAIPWLALPVILSSLFVFLSALLNALGKIGRLAVVQIVATAAMAAGAWPAAHSAIGKRLEFLTLLLGFSAAVSAGSAFLALSRYGRELQAWFCGPGRFWSGAAARQFGSMSAAMLVSGFVASWALLGVRGRIAATQGLAVTGYFDAAWGISMNHVTLVLASLQTYYFPALARSRTTAERDGHISRVLTLATLVAAVVIAGIAWLKPWLLTLLYSGVFRPAAAYLRWTLLGDYLKVTSWILSMPILAAADMKMFLSADLVAYGVFVGAALGLTRWMPAAQSAGVAFLLMYAAHLMTCAIYLWRIRRFVPTRLAALSWVAGLGLVATVSAFTWRQP